MKLRIAVVFAVILFTVSFFGCNKIAGGPAAAETAAMETPAETPEPAEAQQILVASVDTSMTGSAAVTRDGDLYLWGDGQATPVKKMEGVQSVALGNDFGMALMTDGTLWAWGDNASGQIGNVETVGWKADISEPIKIMEHVRQIDAGNWHALAVTEDSELYTWGGNDFGQLGVGEAQPENLKEVGIFAYGTPQMIMSGIALASAGGLNTAAVTTDGALYCWGDNRLGAVGNGEFSQNPLMDDLNVFEPYHVMDGIRSVTVGNSIVGAVGVDGSMYLWGDNTPGYIDTSSAGSGDMATGSAVIALPKKVMDKAGYVSPCISGSSVIGTDGNLYEWTQSYNGDPNNINNASMDSFTNQAFMFMQAVSAVSRYETHTLAVTQDGKLYAWGDNSVGQLGNGKIGDGDVFAFSDADFIMEPALVTLDPNATPSEIKQEIKTIPFPEPLEKSDLSLNGATTLGLAATDGEYVYCPEVNVIRKIDLIQQTYTDLQTNSKAFYIIGADSGYIYYSDFQKLYRINSDGSGEFVYPDTGDNGMSGSSWVVYGNEIFTTVFSNDAPELHRLDMATGAVQKEETGFTINAADSENFYSWIDNNIYRVPRNGGKADIIATNASTDMFSAGIVASEGWVYYRGGNDNILYRVKTDGTDQQALGMKTDCFNVAGGYLFYGNLDDDGKLCRANTDGTEPVRILDKGNMRAIDICAGRVFFNYFEISNEDSNTYIDSFASILPDGSNLINSGF